MRKCWWHGKIAYQIYPKSFADSNGDGIGDLRGIISKLDYLKDLGVDILWLSPIFASPFIDNGYDIADYRNIAPVFGSMDDFDELVEQARKRGLKIILDLVVNHCSSENAMFKKALKDPFGKEASYFYFVKGKDGRAPDNLRSYFGGSVWEKVEGYDDLYYLHYFAREQPDFNWNNKELREKVYEMVNWWLDKGVSGFRIDAIMNIVKDTSFPGLPPDNNNDGMCAANKMTAKLSFKAKEYLKELRDRTFLGHDAFTVGEAFGLNDSILPDYLGDDGCFGSIFDFTAREVFEKEPGYYAYPEVDIAFYRDSNFSMQEKANTLGFVAPIIENHDEPRAISLYLKPSQQNKHGAKALATAFMFLRGIPFIYEGQELGMTNTRFDSIDEFNDLSAFEEYRKCKEHGLGDEEALKVLNLHSRDHGRTPMLWDNSVNAGFSQAKPWLKIHQDYETLNVKAELADPDSTLNYYRKLTRLRKDPRYVECFTYGVFRAGDTSDREIVCYNRHSDAMDIMIFVNFSDSERKIQLPEDAQLLISSEKAELITGTLTVQPCSAVVVRIR
ncbi:MAG: alpha-glucosidase [Succinivibrio sp.]|nr:alpha-glucosidase [Succinivibrio sp.]